MSVNNQQSLLRRILCREIGFCDMDTGGLSVVLGRNEMENGERTENGRDGNGTVRGLSLVAGLLRRWASLARCCF
jgi:hypothetical protein